MSQTSGFALAWLRLTGDSVTPAEVDFMPGLNVISGASDTGKSFVLACVNFMLGAESPPKPIGGLDAYSTALLGIVERSGTRRVLERGLKGGHFRVYEAGADDWSLASPEARRWKHSPDRKDTISHLLLSAVGLESAVILKNKSGNTRKLSFRDLSSFVLVDEERIISERTPVLPTGQWTKPTEELSVFSLLVTGNDWSKVVALPDIKVEKAAWQVRSDLYDQLITELRQEVGDSPPSDDQLARRINECDKSIVELTSRIEESSRSVSQLMAGRQTAWEDSHRARSRLLVIEQLQDRFNLLRKHYESDLERLKFISEGDFLLSQLGPPHCPFCGTLLEEHTAEQLKNDQQKETSIHEAGVREVRKITANLKDLDQTLAALREEQGQLEVQVRHHQTNITTAEGSIRKELEPRLLADKQNLVKLVEEKTRLVAQQSALARLGELNRRRAALGNEPRRTRGSGSSISAAPSATSLRQFGDEIAALLTSWRYKNVGVVDFDEKLDLVVNGQVRRSHGKGIRAVLHAAFTVGLMRHCGSKGLKHPGFVLLDSPLTSYKEKDAYEVDEDIQTGFFESLSTMPQHEQVVVFENKEPPSPLPGRIHHVHFSGTQGMGRKGFFPDAGGSVK